MQQAIELCEDLPREAWAIAVEAPGAIFRRRFLTALNDPTWVRFVNWEALDYPRSRPSLLAAAGEHFIDPRPAGPGDADDEMIQL